MQNVGSRPNAQIRARQVFHFVASGMGEARGGGLGGPHRRTNPSSLTPQRLTTDSAHGDPCNGGGISFHGGSVFP
jgi:hypothetical protein